VDQSSWSLPHVTELRRLRNIHGHKITIHAWRSLSITFWHREKFSLDRVTCTIRHSIGFRTSFPWCLKRLDSTRIAVSHLQGDRGASISSPLNTANNVLTGVSISRGRPSNAYFRKAERPQPVFASDRDTMFNHICRSTVGFFGLSLMPNQLVQSQAGSCCMAVSTNHSCIRERVI
jgi:hypothetical protein